jgi:hypothetical protein
MPRRPPSPEETAAPPITVASLSDDELVRLLAEGQKELAARRGASARKFLARVIEEANALGIDPEDITAAIAKKH